MYQLSTEELLSADGAYIIKLFTNIIIMGILPLGLNFMTIWKWHERNKLMNHKFEYLEDN